MQYHLHVPKETIYGLLICNLYFVLEEETELDFLMRKRITLYRKTTHSYKQLCFSSVLYIMYIMI